MMHMTGRKQRRISKNKENSWGMLCNAFCICVVVEPPFTQLCYHLHLFFPTVLSAQSDLQCSLSTLQGYLGLCTQLQCCSKWTVCMSSEVTLLIRQKLPSISNASRNTSHTVDEYKPLLFSCIQKLCCSCNKTLTAWIRREKKASK